MSIHPRDIIESGIDARVAAIVEPEIEALGFRLVRVQLSGQNGRTMQIMVERPDGMINVSECEAVSRALSPLLDIEEPVQGNYHLEISSPGIDRPLVRRSDFETWAGHVAKLETTQMINGRKRFKGTILATDGNEVTFRRELNDNNDNCDFVICIEDMASVKLILTDDLIRESLRRDKALRQANGLGENDRISDDNSGEING
ncbi:MAG: ribosome maturation factor RimP [Hyphomicrobiales bacterium]|nr:ribosome maturation factor RimP [Hyphomicrobiales bacterium]